MNTGNVNIISNSYCEESVMRINNDNIRIDERFFCSKATPYLHLGKVSIHNFKYN
jgi:hypothetical protein